MIGKVYTVRGFEDIRLEERGDALISAVRRRVFGLISTIASGSASHLRRRAHSRSVKVPRAAVLEPLEYEED